MMYGMVNDYALDVRIAVLHLLALALSAHCSDIIDSSRLEVSLIASRRSIEILHRHSRHLSPPF